MDVLSQPTKTPDLNVIENVSGELIRSVYLNGKQYINRNDLIITIRMAWFEVSKAYLQTLYTSQWSGKVRQKMHSWFSGSLEDDYVLSELQ